MYTYIRIYVFKEYLDRCAMPKYWADMDPLVGYTTKTITHLRYLCLMLRFQTEKLEANRMKCTK